jgi:two-component system CheB/CheR fusion protein
VEDDPDLAEMLENLLRGEGHQVTTAHDGPGALERLATLPPDLVLADYNLPNGPNGVELAKLIRAATGSPVPILILSGDISHATMRAVAEAGCAPLSKPAGLQALRDAIARLLCPPPATGHPMIFVVDDDDDVRGLIVAVLEADGRSAIGYPSGEALLQAFHPAAGDCLLIDATLPGIGGIDLLEPLRSTGHKLPVIVVTGQSDVPMAIRAMKAGASDFIEKPVSRTDLLASIVDALEGAQDVAKLTARQSAAASRMAGLTPRQREIMTLVLAGHPSKNIAADLGISQRTVENHRASIMERTGAASLPALARLALEASAGVYVT